MSRKYICFNEAGLLLGATLVSLDDVRTMTALGQADGTWKIIIRYTDGRDYALVMPDYDSALRSYTAIAKELGIDFKL